MALSCATSQATIYYTIDDSNPTTASNVYRSTITLRDSATVKAKAIKSGYNDSAVATANFIVNEASD
ncbi:MAG: chitobiase/beta-hexosaminidase C-terminal domain-containing protein [Verrucomicrobiota bacterium]|nr:chitobiase/beta-hexosaminidase C-terminal domain-containing protein [Verrucomicrobiota bacterium]